ncbi:MAG: peptidoglycan DD-metalloendopeptidase family protein [Bacteroidota bacterium]
MNLNDVRFAPFPVLGKRYKPNDYHAIDLDRSHLERIGISTNNELQIHLQQKSNDWERVLYGGYLEHRALYQDSPLFNSATEKRDIHLGIDLWQVAGHPIFAPLDGKVHSLRYNDQELDYGYTLIISHQVKNMRFNTLYGHLSDSIMDLWTVGQPVSRGNVIGHLGDMDQNGGWIPHVHLQLILDMTGYHGDYPGVCSEKDVMFYQSNCPDPTPILILG